MMLHAVLLCGVLFSVRLALTQPTPTTPQVDLGFEIHQGFLNETGQFYNFSNIPYAQPPLGDLRFAAPQEPVPIVDKQVNNGSRFAICPQGIPAWASVITTYLTEGLPAANISAGYTPPIITNLTQQPYGTSEDCLLLDVLVPKAIFDDRGTRQAAPVMVWIHGGGYTLAYKTMYGGGGGLLAASQRDNKEGMIYVALNYRIGLFGFLSGPSFQVDGVANAGLLDQRLALEFVQSHISKFGGDPNRVTVIGESAGGGSTMHQITAYGGTNGKVPFQQAIIQSGAFLPVPSKQSQETIFQRFLWNAGVTNLQQARNLTTDELQLVNQKLIVEAPFSQFTFNPVVDGTFAPALPGELLLHGNYDTSVKLLIGHNVLEGDGFTSPFVDTPETFLENAVLISFPTSVVNNASAYITDSLYPPIYDGSQGYNSSFSRAAKMTTEALFACNANYLARAFPSQAYGYLFSVPPSLHGQDIPYTFYEGPAAAVQNDTLALMMQDYFTNFVISGDPNGAGLPYFPLYSQDEKLLNFNKTIIDTIDDELENYRCRWWQKGLY